MIKDDKFKKLVQSIQSFPEMLELRPIVVNDDLIVLGGNMRLKACKEAGMKKVPVIKASSLTEDQQREFIIKDNVGFGEWDMDALINNWNSGELEEWGIDLPVYKEAEEPEEALPTTQFFINIRCDDESHCQKLYERFLSEGLDVKIVT